MPVADASRWPLITCSLPLPMLPGLWGDLSAKEEPNLILSGGPEPRSTDIERAGVRTIFMVGTECWPQTTAMEIPQSLWLLRLSLDSLGPGPCHRGGGVVLAWPLSQRWRCGRGLAPVTEVGVWSCSAIAPGTDILCVNFQAESHSAEETEAAQSHRERDAPVQRLGSM